ncbi:PQQ-dependent sugar dehydrogenase [Singulisphaera sp. PoT]|uniref:PQQ-dependent sugar dehydrogenase n=1 Tax=Singulisphaera sp. PoT TaxID=3411797 RepID=UPI003BF602FC
MPSSRRSGRRLLAVLCFLPFLLLGLIFNGRLGTSAAEPRKPTSPKSVKAARTPWTTSRLVGSPEPPPAFKVVRAFPNLKFDHPALITRYPEGDRLVVGEQNGVLHTFPNRPDARAELFLDLPKEIKTLSQLPGSKDVEAIYGLAFHPDFAKNRQCFVCYTVRGSDPRQRNLPDGTRVSRFTVTKTDPPRIDAASEEVIIAFLQGGHNGGDIHFGNDGMLYISTGDAGNPNPPDPFDTGQDVSDLLSSILRIDVDRKDEGKNYAVPKDNPFVALKGARPEVWALGFRNPWRMSFDRQTGELFVGDVGWELWESIHRVEKGGNYGWSAMEGPQPIKTEKVGPTPIRPALIPLPHTIACSITGGLVYRGKKFPELQGAYIFGDWETRRLWAARFNGDRTTEMPEIVRPSLRIAAFGADKEGEIYIAEYDEGTLYTIDRNDTGSRNSQFPTKLSQTGLFASTNNQTPAAGVVPFKVTSRQWQDGATAEYWVAMPGDAPATLYAKGKPIPGLVDWHAFRLHFPKGSVLVRTLSLAGRRVETQILHYENVDWRAYTFAWRDDQQDADLVPGEGMEKELHVGKQTRTWQFHSRSQCMSCHSNHSEYALAFLPEQLNRPGADGQNQLVAFTRGGLIRRAADDGSSLPPFDKSTAAKERKLVDPADASQPIESRARSYLHANCGHCHADDGGGSVPLRLKFPTPISRMQALDVRPTRGDFSLSDACIIKPGVPSSSTLYFRMSKFGRDRMPHIGSERPDEAGLKIVEQWIASLDPKANKADKASQEGSPDALVTDPKSAMPLARELGRGELKPAKRDAILASAAKLPPGPIRDLFDGYLPSDNKGGRKLGSNPQPRAILAMAGDPSRGEAIFWSNALNCGTCHKVGDRGKQIGPDLSTIGKQRSREDLLESILDPSRRIEPKFAAFLALTADGRSVTGQLVRRDDSEIVLRDSQDQQIALPAKDVEQLQPSLRSLMPDQQIASLTAQEAADLLAYLSSLK